MAPDYFLIVHGRASKRSSGGGGGKISRVSSHEFSSSQLRPPVVVVGITRGSGEYQPRPYDVFPFSEVTAAFPCVDTDPEYLFISDLLA